MSFILRDYQESAINQIRDKLKAGFKRPLMVLPTGGGKSAIFGKIIQSVIENGKKVLWTVHRRGLVRQMQGVLREHFDVEAGIIMAGVESELDKPVQLGTIQTYTRRQGLDAPEYNPFNVNADVVMIDEAHRSISPSYQDVISAYKDKIIIGCTATACRADGRGLGEVYDCLIDVANIKTLTDQGYLAPIRYFVPQHIDLDGVKMSMGDYQVKSLDEKTNTSKLIGDIVENWLRVAENRKTLVFGVNVKHSIAICEAFQRAGVKAEHLDARSSDEEREEVFKSMARGEITVLTNVALYQEGLDVPSVSCIVMARPTKSMGLLRQCIGRGLRPEKDKENCVLLDHGNVIEEHGLLEEDIIWSLDGTKKAWSKPIRKTESKLVRCRACGYVFSGGKVCPECHTECQSFGKQIETIDAELEELKDKKKTNKNMAWADKRIFYGVLLCYAEKKGYKNGWAAHTYKDHFGVWPNDKRVKDTIPIHPEGKFKNLLKYILIKKAKVYKKALDKNP